MSVGAKNSTPEGLRKHFFIFGWCANAFFFSVCATKVAAGQRAGARGAHARRARGARVRASISDAKVSLSTCFATALWRFARAVRGAGDTENPGFFAVPVALRAARATRGLQRSKAQQGVTDPRPGRAGNLDRGLRATAGEWPEWRSPPTAVTDRSRRSVERGAERVSAQARRRSRGRTAAANSRPEQSD